MIKFEVGDKVIVIKHHSKKIIGKRLVVHLVGNGWCNCIFDNGDMMLFTNDKIMKIKGGKD